MIWWNETVNTLLLEPILFYACLILHDNTELEWVEQSNIYIQELLAFYLYIRKFVTSLFSRNCAFEVSTPRLGFLILRWNIPSCTICCCSSLPALQTQHKPAGDRRIAAPLSRTATVQSRYRATVSDHTYIINWSSFVPQFFRKKVLKSKSKMLSTKLVFFASSLIWPSRRHMYRSRTSICRSAQMWSSLPSTRWKPSLLLFQSSTEMTSIRIQGEVEFNRR